MTDIVTTTNTEQLVLVQDASTLVVPEQDTQVIITTQQQGPQGIQGLQGIQGIQGPQGIPGIDGDKHFKHIQAVPAALWTITHNMNKFPSVVVIDSGNNSVEGDVAYIDSNTLTVEFAAGFSGIAYLN